jgi:hypothetical protein
MDDVVLAANFTGLWAIDITASNVVFDLNGHRIGGLNLGPATPVTGIHALDRKNVTIKNGTVRGFQQAVYFFANSFTASSGHRIEGIRVEESTGNGMIVSGTGNIIRGNQVLNTGGVGNQNKGISVSGPGNRILNNDVIETVGSNGAIAFGIMVGQGDGNIVEKNRVTNQTVQSGSAGIQLSGPDDSSTSVLVIGNRVSGYETGVSADIIIGSAKCRDNFFAADVTTYLNNCTDAGNNN